MADTSLYEQKNSTRQQTNTGIAFGRITRVYPEERMCEVKTFFGQGLQDDNSISKCQWINMDNHPEGDESTSIPRVNSYGLVFWVGGQPFIFGFFSPLTKEGSASIQTDDKEELNEGDKTIKTVGKNKIILRAHGEIEVHGTDTCRTIWFPDSNILNTLCRNYEFRTDGGTVDWLNLEDSGKTICSTEYRDNIKRSNVIIEEKGSVDGKIISRTTIGNGTSDGGIGNPVWTRTIQNTGETELFIRAPGAANGHKCTIIPDGTTKIEIGEKAVVIINASGETNVDIGNGSAVLNITPGGNISVTNKGTTNIKTTGAVDLTTDATLHATSKGKTSFDVGGNFEVTAKGMGKIKAKQIEIDGGGKLESVLTSPNTVSQFTGLPLSGFSNTVKASI